MGTSFALRFLYINFAVGRGNMKNFSSLLLCLETLQLANSLHSSTVKFNSSFAVLVAATFEDV